MVAVGICMLTRFSAAQQATFKASTDAVYVTATVIDKDSHLVVDLTKDDFEIRDNGVVRPITIFRNDTLPFAIVIMLDVSGSMMGNLGLMRQGMSEFVQQFEPGDRANIGTFKGLPEVSPRFTANPQALLGSVTASLGGAGVVCAHQFNPKNPLAGGTAVWDAIGCGIETVAGDGETPRRVVMVVSDGKDNVSQATASEVRELAQQYGVMIYAIGMLGEEGIEARLLRDLAEQTGGGYFKLSDPNQLVETFGRVATELRHQYVFGFTAESAEPRRHDLKVRALRPNVTTRARQVYMDSAAPLVTPASAPGTRPMALYTPPAAASPPATPVDGSGRARGAMFDVLDAYERGDPLASRSQSPNPNELWAQITELQSAADELESSAGRWIRERGASQEARRRLVVATYVLERLATQTSDISLWQSSQPGWIWLEWACKLLRTDAPQPAERLWHAAAIGLLERFGAASVLRQHLEHADARFPGEPRWQLARAVAEELPTWPERRDERSFSMSAASASRLVDLLTKASAFEPVKAEAQLRLGYLELRRGRFDAALGHLDRVTAPGDGYLRYWAHLFRGQALERLGRAADAVDSYQRAFDEAPYAQSASLALGAALVDAHRAGEAAALVARMLAVPPPRDPWDVYPFADWRLVPRWITDLRKAIAQ